MKLMAVFRAMSHRMFSVPAGFSGSHFWHSRERNRMRNPAALNRRTAVRYFFQSISREGSTPATR